jgi:glycosyltransferase involved in cell wall biosynthesis
MQYKSIPCKYETYDGESLTRFVNSLSVGEAIVIVGANYSGCRLYDFFSARGIEVRYFCDSDANKLYQIRRDRTVYPLSKLIDNKIAEKIVIVDNPPNQKTPELLVAKGIPASNIFVPMRIQKNCDYLVPAASIDNRSFKKYEIALSPRVKQNCNAPIVVFCQVYNVPSMYLRRAIESVLAQTFSDFRFVILDNGSTDGSHSIILEYAQMDARIEVITAEKNSPHVFLDVQGNDSKEIVLRKLTSKYVCTIDSDDYYSSSFLGETYKAAEKYNADIVTGSYLNYAEKTPQTAQMEKIPIGTAIYRGKHECIQALSDYGCRLPALWGKLYKTETFLDRNSWIMPIEQTGAYDVSHSCYCYVNSKSLAFIDDIVYFHTNHDAMANATVDGVPYPILRHILCYEQQISILNKYGMLTERNVEFPEYRLFYRGLIHDVDLLLSTGYNNPNLIIDTYDEVRKNKTIIAKQNDHRVIRALQRLERGANDAKERIKQTVGD